MSAIPAFKDIGKTAKDLLSGGKDGFQYNKKITISSKTADGVEFVTSAVSKADGVDTSLKGSYKYQNATVTTTVDSSGKVAVSSVFADVAPNLNISLSGTLPDTTSGKLAIDYSIPYLTLGTAVSLTSAPKVDIAATTGYEGLVLGGDGLFDTTKNQFTKWNLGFGYSAYDYQVGLLLTDNGDQAKFVVGHAIDATQAVAAEVSRPVASKAGETAFALGYSKALLGGALTKFRFDNKGTASFLYETLLESKSKMVVSYEIDTIKLDKPAKFGFALSHSA